MLRNPSVSAHRQSVLEERAACMCQQMTLSEAALWQAILGNRLGTAFRRQVVIGGKYIVDFLAQGDRLIVEVDGAYHRGRTTADARRDRYLARLGYRVVRVDAEVVLRQLEVAVEQVRDALGHRR